MIIKYLRILLFMFLLFLYYIYISLQATYINNEDYKLQYNTQIILTFYFINKNQS
jgi:hypothetical protein